MTADHVPPGREFQVGRVLARSASVLFRNRAPFGLLALAVTSPTYLYALLIGSAARIAKEGADSREIAAVFD